MKPQANYLFQTKTFLLTRTRSAGRRLRGIYLVRAASRVNNRNERQRRRHNNLWVDIIVGELGLLGSWTAASSAYAPPDDALEAST